MLGWSFHKPKRLFPRGHPLLAGLPLLAAPLKLERSMVRETAVFWLSKWTSKSLTLDVQMAIHFYNSG
jgi:hypothetical protein